MNKKDNNKRIAKNTVLLYCRQLISLGLSLYTSRLVLKILGETDFGIYATVGGITAFLSVIITSMSASSQRFLSFNLGKGDIKGVINVFSTSNQIHVFLALIILVLGETVGLWFVNNHLNIESTRLHVAIIVYQISLLNCIFAIISVPYNALIIANECMGAFALFSIGDTILKFIGVILLPFISIDYLIGYALIICVVQLFSRLTMWWFCAVKFPNIKYCHKYYPSLFKQMFGIAGWNSLNSIATTCYLQGSVITLNIFFGPIINAAYSVAMQAYSGLRQFCSSFQSASAPQIVKYYAVEENDALFRLLGFVCKISFFLLFFLTLPFVLTANNILSFWLENVPPYASIFFIWMIISAYFDIFSYPLDIAAQASGNMAKYSCITSTLTILILPVTYQLYCIKFPPETILCVAVIIGLVNCLVRIKILSSLIGLCFKTFTLNIICRCILTAAISSIIPILSKLYLPTISFRILIIIGITILSTSIGIWFFGLEQSEQNYISSNLKKIKYKLIN
ncbi:lipopolysaccharide biosynthesis protein [Muribaculum intestinale]|jgi:O-antigen/teichoic acid export membrane protein|uniref:lipopolysaccharide biosynthesis protein n=2 Tax=Muribaculum intestinale TaxID=1796646 RepID=UPI001C3EF9CB|nr:lipopolysaccharide biosynthesis protein [Muribaculum intestinale]